MLVLVLWLVACTATGHASSPLLDFERLRVEVSRGSPLRSALDLQDKIFEEMSMFEQEFEAEHANSTEFEEGSERFGQFGDEEI